MKNDTFETSGRITNKGEPGFYQYTEFLDWCNQWIGKRFIMKCEIIDGSSEKQAVYFRKNILQQFIKCMHETGDMMTEQQAEDYIFMTCPFTMNLEERIPFEKMNTSLLSMVIEWVKLHMAQNFDKYIND